MKDCLFCKIVAGELGTQFLYEDEWVVVFNDINPKAPVHQLIVPRKHVASVNELAGQPEGEPVDLEASASALADITLPGRMIQVARHMAVKAGIDQSGYRLIFNCGPDGRQEVYHLHLHLLGGKQLCA